MTFNLVDKNILDVCEVKNSPFEDHRGSFFNIFKSENEEFKKTWGNREIKQINLSHTKNKGTIRGMHMQKDPFAEAKLITCIKGKIWDVVVDLRRNSPSFGNWCNIVLSSELNNSLFIPEGFAHGFQSLENNVEMIYVHSQNWSKDHETGIYYKDLSLNITWPLEEKNLSQRDLDLPSFNSYENSL